MVSLSAMIRARLVMPKTLFIENNEMTGCLLNVDESNSHKATTTRMSHHVINVHVVDFTLFMTVTVVSSPRKDRIPFGKLVITNAKINFKQMVLFE